MLIGSSGAAVVATGIFPKNRVSEEKKVNDEEYKKYDDFYRIVTSMDF
ncbi:hypothetical protein MSUIS_05470 [Mycoplasma suis KI3806]|uniref:Uncharacterized protein n=1 Tax=Mycoplasma suis (strain KI_3806) TaxID=708248 RepID=F0V1V9_MYCS3|nr:hypothetical protein [Mycoplasma suis]CBZ40640.1 hypothetical protein MSUIS_05470 [Mycoplasma suis KI3806]